MVTVTYHKPGEEPAVIAETHPEKRLAKPVAVGLRSGKLAQEVAKLKAAHAEQSGKVKELEAAVQERQSKLGGLRAAGLLETVDKAKMQAFEKELSDLRAERACRGAIRLEWL